MKIEKLRPEFVEFIPLELEEGILYISMRYATAAHLCACGCKQKVITPISPHTWSILYNGESVTFSPSIGNYEQECISHYFIRNNRIIWCSNCWNKVDLPKKTGKSKKRKKYKWLRFLQKNGQIESRVNIIRGY